MEPFVMAPFVMGPFVMGPFLMGPYVGVLKGHWKWWALKLQQANPSFYRLFSCVRNI